MGMGVGSFCKKMQTYEKKKGKRVVRVQDALRKKKKSLKNSLWLTRTARFAPLAE